jgi:hypothetical protein
VRIEVPGYGFVEHLFKMKLIRVVRKLEQLTLALENFAMRGVAIWGVVYVPIPACEVINSNCQGYTPGAYELHVYLVIDHLLVPIVFLESGEKLHNVRVL